MGRCKAHTKSGKRCKNTAGEDGYCHIPSHCSGDTEPNQNPYWTYRETSGRKPLFKKPIDLWKECVAYFQWVESNPLKEEKVFHSAGVVTKTEVSKMRAMTIRGLCLYIGIARSTWQEYCKKEDFSAITTRVEDIIYSQKLEGAAADLLNSNIIARELGLKDRKDHSSDDGSMSPRTLDDFYNELNNASDSD